MGITRKEIESMHEQLQDIENMEKFIKNQENDENTQWLRINSPHNEYFFLNGYVREEFIEFVKQQIELLKLKLNLEL